MGWVPLCAFCSLTCWSKAPAIMLWWGNSPPAAQLMMHTLLWRENVPTADVAPGAGECSMALRLPPQASHILSLASIFTLLFMYHPVLHVDCRVWNTLPQTLTSSALFLFENILLNQPLHTDLAFLSDPSICFLVNCSIFMLLSHWN